MVPNSPTCTENKYIHTKCPFSSNNCETILSLKCSLSGHCFLIVLQLTKTLSDFSVKVGGFSTFRHVNGSCELPKKHCGPNSYTDLTFIGYKQTNKQTKNKYLFLVKFLPAILLSFFFLCNWLLIGQFYFLLLCLCNLLLLLFHRS